MFVKELVDLLDDQHGIRHLLHLVDDALEAVFHLTFVLRITAQSSGLQLIRYSSVEESRHFACRQLTNETVYERGLTDSCLTGDEEVRFGLTA